MMKLKGVVMEDFVNYKKPSLFLITSQCDWKCCKELGIDISICQNEPMAKQETKDVSAESIYNAYINNDITKAIILADLSQCCNLKRCLMLLNILEIKDAMTCLLFIQDTIHTKSQKN